MRKSVLIASTLMFLAGAAYAQEPKTAAPAAPAADAAAKPAKQKPAKLVADPNTVELGTFDAGATKDVTLHVKNEGEKEAKNVACKGKGFKFDPAKVPAIAGGEATDIKATYTAPKKAAKKEKPVKASISCGAAKFTATGTMNAAPAPEPKTGATEETKAPVAPAATPAPAAPKAATPATPAKPATK